MSGYFKIKAKNKIGEMEIGDRIDESDFSTLTTDGTFVQLEYVTEDDLKVDPFAVKPGIFGIIRTPFGLRLEETGFTKDAILESFVNTKEITDKIDMFFENVHVYKEFGFDIAKRGILLFGPAGSGKSTSISAVSRRYANDKTLILVWNTDKFESHEVKDFIKRFNYEGVERFILIAEDIGGIEMDGHRMQSDSSLLALLDNQEKTFTIATMIIATTNYPENFMGNLTNRPNRFDDKIKVGYPSSQARKELLKFFDKRNFITTEALLAIGSKKCEAFTPAHIREVIVRSAIHKKDPVNVINEMLTEIKLYEKGFQESRSAGFLSDDDFE